jgi:hypothetical protein
LILQTIFDMPSKKMILSSTEAIQKQKLKPIREASKHLSTRWGWMNESWFIPLPSSELTVGNAIIFLHRGCVIAQSFKYPLLLVQQWPGCVICLNKKVLSHKQCP